MKELADMTDIELLEECAWSLHSFKRFSSGLCNEMYKRYKKLVEEK